MRLALSFLTRIPVGHVQADDYLGALGRQAPFFPVVGLVVGAVTLAADYGTGMAFGPVVRSAVAVAAGVWITGALHLDGLMDTADGVGSHRSRERMLEIMKDSRVGAMGVVAGALTLLLRFALLTEVAPGLRWQALLVAPALGRMAMVLAAGLWPDARQGQGLGSGFAAHVGPVQVTRALGLGFVIAAVAGHWRGAVAFGVSAALTLLCARSLAARLGGLTGDTYGTVNEVAEVGALAVFAAQGVAW